MKPSVYTKLLFIGLIFAYLSRTSNSLTATSNEEPSEARPPLHLLQEVNTPTEEDSLPQQVLLLEEDEEEEEDEVSKIHDPRPGPKPDPIDVVWALLRKYYWPNEREIDNPDCEIDVTNDNFFNILTDADNTTKPFPIKCKFTTLKQTFSVVKLSCVKKVL